MLPLYFEITLIVLNAILFFFKLKNRELIYLTRDEVHILLCDLYKIIFCVFCTHLPLTNYNLYNIRFWYQIRYASEKKLYTSFISKFIFLKRLQEILTTDVLDVGTFKIQIKAWIAIKVHSPIEASFTKRICISPTD